MPDRQVDVRRADDRRAGGVVPRRAHRLRRELRGDLRLEVPELGVRLRRLVDLVRALRQHVDVLGLAAGSAGSP